MRRSILKNIMPVISNQKLLPFLPLRMVYLLHLRKHLFSRLMVIISMAMLVIVTLLLYEMGVSDLHLDIPLYSIRIRHSLTMEGIVG
jgi:hypothetical protein